MPRQLCKRMKCWPVVVTAVLAVMGGAAYAAGIWTAPVAIVSEVVSKALPAVCAYPQCFNPTTQPDPDDDPQPVDGPPRPPCKGGCCGAGGGGSGGEPSSSTEQGSVGPGLHVTIATGNVWTRVPILKVYGGGETTLDLTLTYNSIRSSEDPGENRGLGYGWTHSYNIYWYPVPAYPEYPENHLCSDFSTKAVVVDGDGRRNAYLRPDNSPQSGYYFLTPAGRNAGLRYDDCGPNDWHNCLVCTHECLEYECCAEPMPSGCLSDCEDPDNKCCSWDGWWCTRPCDTYDCCEVSWTCTQPCGSVGIENCCTVETSAYPVCTRPLYVQEYPDGSRREFGANRRISRIVTARGLTTTFSYDSSDPESAKLTAITEPYGRTVSFGYDDGLLTSITAPDQSVTTLTYDAEGRLLSVTDPLGQGHTQSFEYSDIAGCMSKETLKNGASYTCEYTASSRTIKDSAEPAATVLQWTSSGDSINVTDGRGKAWTYHTNEWQQLTEVQTPADPLDGYYTSTAQYYDNASHPETLNRLAMVTDAREHWEQYDWNGLGLVRTVTEQHDLHDLITTFQYAYEVDPNALIQGLLTKRTDPSGASWYYTYNVKGDLTAVCGPLPARQDPSSNCGSETTTTYEYTYYPGGQVHTITKTDRREFLTIWTYGEPETADAGKLLTVDKEYFTELDFCPLAAFTPRGLGGPVG